ncbi:hypothetical protein ACFE04_010275 [Oxalis oulophora]
MSSRRSRQQQSSVSRITDDQIIQLVSKLRQFLPEINQTRRSNKRTVEESGWVEGGLFLVVAGQRTAGWSWPKELVGRERTAAVGRDLVKWWSWSFSRFSRFCPVNSIQLFFNSFVIVNYSSIQLFFNSFGLEFGEVVELEHVMRCCC